MDQLQSYTKRQRPRKKAVWVSCETWDAGLKEGSTAGDRTAYEQMQNTLVLMETFRVPRAAQVWEVPVLTGKIIGGDPYLVRTLVRAEGDAYPVVRLRMRVTAGQGGQFFWTTQASPGFAEDKAVGFAIQADGQFHEYRLEPGADPMWSGQTITGLRIDPGNGAPSAEFGIDYLRGEKE
jgi:hypothetical protein